MCVTRKMTRLNILPFACVHHVKSVFRLVLHTAILGSLAALGFGGMLCTWIVNHYLKGREVFTYTERPYFLSWHTEGSAWRNRLNRSGVFSHRLVCTNCRQWLPRTSGYWVIWLNHNQMTKQPPIPENHCLQFVRIPRYLDINMDRYLSWAPPVQQLHSLVLAVAKIVGYLAGNRWGSDCQSMMQLCKAYVDSLLRYCLAILQWLSVMSKNQLDAARNSMPAYLHSDS